MSLELIKLIDVGGKAIYLYIIGIFAFLGLMLVMQPDMFYSFFGTILDFIYGIGEYIGNGYSWLAGKFSGAIDYGISGLTYFVEKLVSIPVAIVDGVMGMITTIFETGRSWAESFWDEVTSRLPG